MEEWYWGGVLIEREREEGKESNLTEEQEGRRVLIGLEGERRMEEGEIFQGRNREEISGKDRWEG